MRHSLLHVSCRTVLYGGCILLCIQGLWAAGCGNGEEQVAEHRKAAEAFLASGENAKAVIELENLVRLDPRDEAAFQQLGEAFLSLGRFGPAYHAFRRVTLLDPGNLEAQLKLGQLNLFAGHLDDALERAQLVLAGSEDHPGGLALLADIRRMEGDVEAAIDVLNQAVSVAPDTALHRLHLARLYLERGDWRKADAAFQEAARVDPVLEPLVGDENGPYGSRPVMARYYERMGAWKEAGMAYREAAKAASWRDVSPLLDLGAFHVRKGEYPQALEAVEQAASLREHDLDVRVHKAEILMHAGDADQAEVEVEEVLKRYEAHVGANLLAGKLLLAREAWPEALTRFERVVQAKPRFAPGFYYKGLAQARQGDVSVALESLEEAVRLDPELLSARMLLAELYLEHYEKGYLVRAQEHVHAAMQIAPDDLRVLTLLGNLRIREQDLPGAEEVFLQVTRADPAHAMARVRLGFVYHLMGRRPEAIERFRAVLAQDPAESNALAFCTRLLLAEGRSEEALSLCEQAAASPGASARAIGLARHLKGKALLARGDREAAERALLSAVEAEPDLLPPHVLLTRLYLEEKRVPDLVAHFEDVVARSPDFLTAYMVLGMVHDRAGRQEKANAAYRRALEVKPDFAPAANNLAWNLAVGEGRLDEAFGLARTAKSGMPGDPHVSDTMGWIYFLLGHPWKAVGELEQAVSRSPDHPVFNHHLGTVYLEAGEPEKARVFLARALHSSDTFPGAAEARRLLEAAEAQAAKAAPDPPQGKP